MKLEIEKTYTFSCVDSNRIIHTLSRIYDTTKKIKQSYSLHMLIPDERENYKKRLKYSCKKSAVYPVKIVYSPKIRVAGADDVFQTYLEENIEIQPTAHSGANFFPVRFSVSASYFKYRLIFHFAFEKSKVRIAVDQITALNPLDISQKTEPYFNMEVEGADEETIDKTLRLIFDDKLLNCIRLIDYDESKGAIASNFCSDDSVLYFENYGSLVEYVQRVEKECLLTFLQFKLFDCWTNHKQKI